MQLIAFCLHFQGVSAITTPLLKKLLLLLLPSPLSKLLFSFPELCWHEEVAETRLFIVDLRTGLVLKFQNCILKFIAKFSSYIFKKSTAIKAPNLICSSSNGLSPTSSSS